jgi:hypothetical protein
MNNQEDCDHKYLKIYPVIRLMVGNILGISQVTIV